MINGAWYDAMEHLPEPDRAVIGYSAIYGRYYLCKFSPYRGWLALNDLDDISTMTHWLDAELPLTFPLTNSLDREKAKAHGMIRGEE